MWPDAAVQIMDAEGPGLTAGWVWGTEGWGGALREKAGAPGWQQPKAWVSHMPRVVEKAKSMLSYISRSTTAKRLSPFTQRSLEHSWNAAPSFGPYSTRKTAINWNEFSGGSPWWPELGHLPLKEILRDQGVFTLQRRWLWGNLTAVPTNQY